MELLQYVFACALVLVFISWLWCVFVYEVIKIDGVSFAAIICVLSLIILLGSLIANAVIFIYHSVLLGGVYVYEYFS